MTRRQLVYLASVFLVVLATIGDTCGGSGGGSSTANSSGFAIQTLEVDDTMLGYPITLPAPNIYVTGNRQYDLPGATGTIVFIPGWYTNSVGYLYVTYGRAPANWRFAEGNGPCAGKTSVNSSDVYPGATVNLDCTTGSAPAPGSITPSSFNGASPPATITLVASGFDATYAAPQAWIYDAAGNVMYQTPVDTMSGDGTSVSFSSVPALYTGTYLVVIRNVQADGSLVPAGAAQLDVYGNDAPPCMECGMTCDQCDQAMLSCNQSAGYWNYDTCSCDIIP